MQLNIGKKSLDTGKSLFAATSGASGLHLYRVQYGHVHTSQQVYEDVIIISDCLHSLGIKNHTLNDLSIPMVGAEFRNKVVTIIY